MDILKFVIVGHVDHGKSTLIGRLFYDTGSLSSEKIQEIEQVSQEMGRTMEFAFLMDQLKEERDQGITIDTTQNFLNTPTRKYVVVDAPGHVEFVKNMITGASQAEAALLIVDAKEGVQEQTKRHAYILGMLGLSQIIVVMNKMDLAGFDQGRFTALNGQVKSFFDSLHIRAQYYIPISASNGDNVVKQSEHMPWYQGPTILDALGHFKSSVSLEEKPLLFPIQDVYRIDDKRIAVGRIETGSLRQGQEIKILPDRKTTKVKSIEKFLEHVSESVAGESTGVILQDPVFIERGHVVCEPDKEPPLTDTFKANIFWLSRHDFNKEEKITLRCATQEVLCKVEKIEKRINSSTLEIVEEDARQLRDLEVGQVIIKTKKPIAVETFNDVPELGRFVFVVGEDICAGGIITSVG